MKGMRCSLKIKKKNHIHLRKSFLPEELKGFLQNPL